MLNTGIKLYGIYKLDGDSLTVCMSAGERPKDFEARPDHIPNPREFHRESRTPTQLAQECPNAPGCYWAVEPKGADPSVDAQQRDRPDRQEGSPRCPGRDPGLRDQIRGRTPDLEYRPVAFDDKRNAHLPPIVQGGSSGSASIPGVTLVMREYRLDPAVLPYDRVKRLGIEVIPPEVRQTAKAAASERAMQAARDAGIEVLPRPRSASLSRFRSPTPRAAPSAPPSSRARSC